MPSITVTLMSEWNIYMDYTSKALCRQLVLSMSHIQGNSWQLVVQKVRPLVLAAAKKAYEDIYSSLIISMTA